jgi:hypothetical protein
MLRAFIALETRFELGAKAKCPPPPATLNFTPQKC